MQHRESRIFAAYSKLQVLGQRVKNTPNAYAPSAAKRLERRVALAEQMAKNKFLDVSTTKTEKQKLAWQLLKAEGKKVKPFSEYKNRSALIKRASKEVFLEAEKKIVAGTSKWIQGVSKTHYDAQGNKIIFDKWDYEVESDTTPRDALLLAAKFLQNKNVAYSYGNLVMCGILLPDYKDVGFEEYGCLAGPNSKTNLIARNYQHADLFFEVLTMTIRLRRV